MSQPAAAKEKKVSDKDVDLTNQKRDVWLVKVPKYIADRWESGDGGTSVGKISIKPRPVGGPEVMFKLSEEISKERQSNNSSSNTNGQSNSNNKNGKGVNGNMHVWSTTDQEIPSDYRLEFLKPIVLASQHLAVLSQTAVAKDGKSEKDNNDNKESNPGGPPSADSAALSKKLALEGRISCRAECKTLHTTSSEVYMKLKREALLKPNETARKVQKINKLVKVYKPVSNHASNVAHAKKMKEVGKKSRDDKDRVMEALFALFEKHQYYNIKDLVRETRQPVTYLKTILNEVCRYNVKNPHKNMWELKPEYRHYKKDEEEAAKDGENGDKDESSDDDGF